MKNLNFSLPNILILVIVFLIIVFTFKTFINISLKDGNTEKPFYIGIIIYFTGIFVFSILGAIGLFSQLNTIPPRFPLFFIFNFLFLFLVIFQKFEKNLKFLKNIPNHIFIIIQSFRAFLEIVIYLLYLDGITPKEITFLGRSFDLVIGIGALPAAYLVSKGYWKAGIAFNVIGLLSLANIIFVAIFSFPTPFRIFDINYLPTYFPGILIPLFIAPMAIFFHVLSLKQLLRYRNDLVTLKI